jgi:energy-coupling factor transporter ATP-binding protein EcfA2
MQLTVLLIEHRLELVLPHIQELLVLDQGKIIVKGPPGDVFNNPQVSQVGVAVPRIIELLKQIDNPKIRSITPLSVEDALRTVLKEVRR